MDLLTVCISSSSAFREKGQVQVSFHHGCWSECFFYPIPNDAGCVCVCVSHPSIKKANISYFRKPVQLVQAEVNWSCRAFRAMSSHPPSRAEPHAPTSQPHEGVLDLRNGTSLCCTGTDLWCTYTWQPARDLPPTCRKRLNIRDQHRHL